MPRRRWSGVVYIENDIERNVTFFRRRFGLFKGLADLSAITGARAAVILAAADGKMHSFGTPSANAIVDAFLLGGPPVKSFADEATNTRIAWLQSEMDHLDRENHMEEKRKKISIQRIKEIQDENLGMVANHLFSKKEDLNLEDLNKIFNGLLCVQQDMVHRVSLNLVPPRVQSRGGNGNPPSLMHPLGSHMLPHQPSLIQPQPVPHETLAQPFPMQAQKMLQHTELASSSLTPGQEHESPSLLQLPLRNSASPYNTMEPPQNNSSPFSTFEHNIQDPPLLVNC
ncbi:hypothetical protein BRADI_3g39575v3 [Brachypodium distachyon]|uniref:MADS-box domain-containing protein n=1 Tax=Brachypodium distachyon TaxID=15368 RepID=A0A0Q3FI23_BRADI|nr:hypothetical protein BRADI_3g39575v3 [Brachypodium distachyon]